MNWRPYVGNFSFAYFQIIFIFTSEILNRCYTKVFFYLFNKSLVLAMLQALSELHAVHASDAFVNVMATSKTLPLCTL